MFLSTNVQGRASIRDALDDRFHFEALERIHSKEGFWVAMSEIQRGVAAFAPLTGAVFHSKLETVQVRFCQHRFSPTGELGYRGAVGLGYRSTL